MGKDWREDKDGAFRSVGASRYAGTPRDLIAKAPRVPTLKLRMGKPGRGISTALQF